MYSINITIKVKLYLNTNLFSLNYYLFDGGSNIY